MNLKDFFLSNLVVNHKWNGDVNFCTYLWSIVTASGHSPQSNAITYTCILSKISNEWFICAPHFPSKFKFFLVISFHFAVACSHIFLYKVLKLITLYGMIYISLHCLRYLSWFHVQIIISRVHLGTVQRLLNCLPIRVFQCKYGSLWFIRFLRIVYDTDTWYFQEMKCSNKMVFYSNVW